ncbi:MAG: glutathione-dependent formaldehyde dehydrogenase [Bacteriovorax sp.]|nr:glutathione-dependent formaldehyde dehydrogenase [Bacteriovorax sp.]
MKAAVFHKPHDIRYETVPDPIIKHPRDAIIRVTATAICGSDLHIINGLFPQLRNQVLGHEFMGIVEEVGSEVKNLKKGDRVVVPFPIACGGCFFCEHQTPGACENSNPEHYGPRGKLMSEKGGGMFGYTDLYGGYDGGQAEYVRVPYADYGPRKVPDGLTDEQVLFLTDILPTGWSGVDWANVKGGETVVVFGCGPVGLMAQKAAWLKGAARVIGVDVLQYRLDKAHEVCCSEVINNSEGDAPDKIIEMTNGRGADVCIDAVGLEADRRFIDKVSAVIHMQRGTMKVVADCMTAVRRGGHVSIMGVYGTTYDNFPLGQWFDKGITIRAGQAPVHNYIDLLMDHVVAGRIKTNDIISHRLPLKDVSHAYKIFNNHEDNCVKVVLTP